MIPCHLSHNLTLVIISSCGKDLQKVEGSCDLFVSRPEKNRPIEQTDSQSLGKKGSLFLIRKRVHAASQSKKKYEEDEREIKKNMQKKKKKKKIDDSPHPQIHKHHSRDYHTSFRHARGSHSLSLSSINPLSSFASISWPLPINISLLLCSLRRSGPFSQGKKSFVNPAWPLQLPLSTWPKGS